MDVKIGEGVSQAIPVTPPPLPTMAADEGPSFKDVLANLAKEVDKGEKVVQHALGSNPFADDSRGMIALQAGVYRYSESVELCGKLIDRAASAVKTTIQSQ